MKTFTHHLMRVAAGLLIVMLTANMGWAQSTLFGSGTQSEPYLIQSDADWATFVDWINNQNSTYGSMYYKLGADINVNTMAGTSSSSSFKGTFDGDGHTMTLELEYSQNYCAPFQFVANATFTRLHVTGSITTSSRYAGGLCGNVPTSNTNVYFVNCWSSVTITCNYGNYSGYCGGFLGNVAYTTCKAYFTNCRFDGSLIAGVNNTRYLNGFFGNKGDWAYFTNCLSIPISFPSEYSGSFAYQSASNLVNSYYSGDFDYKQGIEVGDMTNEDLQAALGSGWEINADKVVPVFDKKNLTAGSIECDEFFRYTGEEILVTPTVKDMDGEVVDPANYSVSITPTIVLALGNYTMTVTGNTGNGYNGTLTHSFQVINQLNGQGTQANPYTISNTTDWNTFVQAVATGCTYKDQFVQLTHDIEISTMAGVLDDYPFSGTFDGGIYDGNTLTGSHTLTANIVNTDADEMYVAPFHYIYEATIKNLNVAGNITSNSQYTAGLVGFIGGQNNSGDAYRNKITNCVVTATLTIGANYAGGFVGKTNNSIHTSFTDCVFAGTVESDNPSEPRNYAGGILAHGNSSTVYLYNTLEKGTYTNIGSMNPLGNNMTLNQSGTSFYYFNDRTNAWGYGLQESYHCYKVTPTAPEDNIYLQHSLQDYTFYQQATLSGLKMSYAYNGNVISLGYTLKMGADNMTENNHYNVTIKNSNNETVLPANLTEVDNYTISFAAKEDNTIGYAGQTTAYSFMVKDGESLDGYVFATEGEGTEKVYLIENESDLELFAAYVNSGHNASGKTFKLQNDIEMTGEHAAIGINYNSSSSYRFRGTFDGNSKTIANLTINKPNDDYQGLFGYSDNGAIIKDLTLTNCNITGKNRTGGIVGFAGLSTGSSGSMTNVTVQNCSVSGNITGAESVGGIIGLANRATITLCENTASITGSKNCGGIVGESYTIYNEFSQCLNLGIITGNSYVGGVSGCTFNKTSFSNCYYATPCNVQATWYNSGIDYEGYLERAYIISEGEHVTSLTITEDASITSKAGAKYYKAADWTLSFTLDEGYNFINYVCEGGTMTDLDVAEGDHTLTIDFGNATDVTISALMSSVTATDIAGATIATIPEQRWKGGDLVEPTLTVTDGEYTLVEGTDYVVEYTNNTAISQGTATATLTGINNYYGTNSATFNIADFPLLTPGSSNTASNPYLIATEADLQALACIVNNGARSGGFYKQTDNITLTEEHTAIGTNDNRFEGSYNGDNHTISGLIINKPTSQYQGLFGYFYGTTRVIERINLLDCDITGNKYVGGIVGYLSYGTVKDCTVSGEIKAGGKNSESHGGIVGYSVGSNSITKIENCINTASVTGDGRYHGGIVGYGYYGKASNCFNAGTVEGTHNVGSIAGNIATGSNYFTLTDNYHTAGTTGGVGIDYYSTTGTDQTGAEVVVKITAAADIMTFVLPETPTYVWNSENLYKSGTVVTLDYDVPVGMVFDHYAVNSGEISNSGVANGEHTLTDFSEDVHITATCAEMPINLEDGHGAIADIADLIFNGLEQHPAPVVTYDDVVLVENNNYTVTYSEGCTNKGTYTITVTGAGRYYGTLTKDFTINAFNISGDGAISILGLEADYGQTGSAVHPTPAQVTCTAIDNAILVLDTDYGITYDGACILPGNYNMNLNGQGNYTGTKTIPFTILEAYGITLNNGATSCILPVDGCSTHSYWQKNEFVMSSTALTAMTGKAITSMQFYIRDPYPAKWNDTFKVFMKEVDYTAIASDDGYSGLEGATIVYEGELDNTSAVMTVSFTTPYIYQGGNLLIGFYTASKGNQICCNTFYGETTDDYTSIQATNYSNPEAITSGTRRKILPKTTFWYQNTETATLEVAGYGESTDNDKWVFIASPVVQDIVPSAANGFIVEPAANYDLYRFNQSATKEWENYKAHTQGFVLENGKGYLYASKEGATLTFTGTQNSDASKEVALDYDNDAELAGWNLVGNPFNASATIDMPYYKMNDNGNGVEGVENPESNRVPIAAHTGVLVQATGEDQTVTFTKVEEEHAAPSQGNLEVVLTQTNTRSNAKLDNAIVSFNEGSRLGKFYFGHQSANIYIPQDREEYAIVCSNKHDEIPVNFKATENGTYTLTVNPNGVEMSYLHLVDNLTGADINLLVTPSYTFEGKTSDYASRFKLVFASSGTNMDDDFAFIEGNGNLIVNGDGIVQIIDMLGQVLVTRNVHSDFRLPTSDFQTGVYVLRLINGENVKKQKIIIKK